MALPTGSGSERVGRGTVNDQSNTATAFKWDFSSGVFTEPTTGTSSYVVPALHLITVLNVTFQNASGSDEELIYMKLYNGANDIMLLNAQPLPPVGTFIYSDKIILHPADKIIVFLGSAGNVDISYHFIDQDFS